MADYSKMTTAQLEAMLAKMKAEKIKTGSTLSVDQIKNAQNKINNQDTRIPSNIKIYSKGSGTRKPSN
jgi:hydroxymethylpyrimidine/phosphomethylpyrimidine kinase